MNTCGLVLAVFALLAPALVVSGLSFPGTLGIAAPAVEMQASDKEMVVQIQYLEIVTRDLSATCSALEKVHGVTFGEPVAAFGNARIAKLKGGGSIGVRAPMRGDEEPVVRPYILVSDVDAAVKAAEASGAEFAMYPTEIPGHGKFAIYFQGGIQFGLWEL